MRKLGRSSETFSENVIFFVISGFRLCIFRLLLAFVGKFKWFAGGTSVVNKTESLAFWLTLVSEVLRSKGFPNFCCRLDE